jgi:alkanesulfonate monooxygenase SsuD/methylene tetrahydromethanopterin reductase-like flavin-dependent oxidoreductase (luciferase family)
MAHRSGPFRRQGRFDSITMAHFDRDASYAAPAILAAGVGNRMVQAAGRVADGFVGHTVASARNLSELAKPVITSALTEPGRAPKDFLFTSQVIASVDEDHASARNRAALQVGFYSTPKGYDALFPDERDELSRVQAREAFIAGDITGVGQAGLGLVDERAVFGSSQDISAQLARYNDILDLALLYPPYFGIEPDDVTKNEYSLIEVARQWNRH